MSNSDDKTVLANNKRQQFGTRFLTENSDVFQHNAWDNVEWTEEQEKQAQDMVKKQLAGRLPDEDHLKYLQEPCNHWNQFYEKHDNRFFKDRHWLFTEFPELLPKKPTTPPQSVEDVEVNHPQPPDKSEAGDTRSSFPGSQAKIKFMEVGCGAGNTIFPVLRTNNDPEFFMYACDYSSTAIDVVKSNPAYDESRCYAFVHDISGDDPYPIPENSLDAIVMIFVLSALSHEKMAKAVGKISSLLKPGGVLLFRDYGRYDMAQLRFKSNRCLAENFYTRGDGTLVYFFTQEEIRSLFSEASLIEEQNLVDRRLQVNRARQLKMFRVWIQAKYRKPKT